MLSNLSSLGGVIQESGRPIFVYTVLTDDRDISLCVGLHTLALTKCRILPSYLELHSSLMTKVSSVQFTSYRVCLQHSSEVFFHPQGVDYAFHDDLIPYTCKNSRPLTNEYFEDFMHYDPDKEPHFYPTDNLCRWLESRRSSLEVKTVHRETTEGIRVTAVPCLMGRRKFRFSDETLNHYWRYLIRLENLTDECVQLRERFWKLFSVNGSLESVAGKGVVGLQPTLTPHSPVFQYHSHVQVPVARAHMWGQFRLEKTSGGTIDVKIPAFPLFDRENAGPRVVVDDDDDGNNNNGGHSPGQK
uniref:ApaG domain-containing protein n=1 Tax=Mesocestoides corti TaxID=53468 RepID=A0A5K3F9Z7_MESCO